MTIIDERCSTGNGYFNYDGNDGQCVCITGENCPDEGTTSYYYSLYYANAGHVVVDTSSDECHAYENVGGCVNGENIEKLTDKTIRECHALCSANTACLGVEFFEMKSNGATVSPNGSYS